jgi:hypothetical protein
MLYRRMVLPQTFVGWYTRESGDDFLAKSLFFF